MKKIVLCVCILFFSASVSAEKFVAPEIFNELKSVVDLKQGEFIYIDFWASWCKPCRKSFPWMNSMEKKYKKNGFKFLAINLDKERQLADVFLKEVPSNIPIFYDAEGRFASAFRLKGVPSSFMMDDQGYVRVAHQGFLEKDIPVYEQDIISLLKK